MSLKHTRVQHEGAGHWVVDFVGDDGEAEAAIDGVLIGCLYLPNGNPAPGPKFDYKLRQFRRLQEYAMKILEPDILALPVGDFNVMPTALDVYKAER